jgi:regulator of sigma E protease
MEAPPETETRAVAPASSSNFRDKPLASRALVLAGGPLANYLAAILLYFGLFATVGVRGPVVAIEVDRVQASVAEQLDLQVGDELVAVANVPIDLSRDGRDVLELAEANRGETVALEIRRDGVQRTVSVPIPADSDESLPFAPGRRYDGWVPVGLGEAARLSVEKPWAITVLQLEGLGRLLRFDTQNAKPTGPVGIVREIANQASEGLIPLLLTTAFISTLLGLFNLLPIPALDGGRLVFLAWEGVTRRRANPNIEEAVHAYGLLALLALILVVTFFDVNRLVS